MKPRITLVTLAVENLQRAVQFYSQGMGLVPKESSARSSSTVPSHSSICNPVCGWRCGREAALRTTPVCPSQLPVHHRSASRITFPRARRSIR